MTNKGFIYVLLNPSQEKVSEIGISSEDPATRLPQTSILTYREYFDDRHKALLDIHTLLKNKGFDAAQSMKENSPFLKTDENLFFKVPIYIAIQTIHEYKLETENSASQKHTTVVNPLAFTHFEEATNYYYGGRNTPQDHQQAYSLFEKSADFGSLKALEFLGRMTAEGAGCEADTQKALTLFKQGAVAGNRHCYFEMGKLYCKLDQHDKAEKYFSSYFNMLDMELVSEDDIGNFTYYVDFYFETLKQKYTPIFAQFKNKIIDKLRFYTKIATQSVTNDEEYANSIRALREERISWLDALPVPDADPTICSVWGVNKTEMGILLFADVLKGTPHSLRGGDRILIQSPSQTLEVEILYIFDSNPKSPTIHVSHLQEDHEKFLFVKEGAVMKPLS